MLVLSAAARVLIPIFPTDQGGSRFQTLKGTIHMLLAVAIFASIAVAASNLGPTLGNETDWRSVKGLVDGWLPWVITITASLTGIAIISPQLKRIFGLLERSYYASSIAWFFVVSIELARSHDDAGRREARRVRRPSRAGFRQRQASAGPRAAEVGLVA
jgi:hypothetical protein